MVTGNTSEDEPGCGREPEKKCGCSSKLSDPGGSVLMRAIQRKSASLAQPHVSVKALVDLKRNMPRLCGESSTRESGQRGTRRQ